VGDDKLTIVGPEPTGTEDRKPQKRVNVEALLLMAKYDDGFKERLFADREKALLDSGIDFTPGEKLLLTNITDEQLAENIDEFRVPGVTKKSLPTWAKAAQVIFLLSTLGFLVTVPMLTLGIPPDEARRKRAGIAEKASDIEIKNFSSVMAHYLKTIRQRLKAESIEDIIEDYNNLKEECKHDSTISISHEIDMLMNDIKEKVNASIDINTVLDQYEVTIGKADPDFSKIKHVTYQMVVVLWQIQDIIKEESSDIEDILKEYDAMISDDQKRPDKERKIKPEIIELINEVKEKVEAGSNGYYVIDKLVDHIFKMGVGQPAGIMPDDRSPFRQLGPEKQTKNNRGK
jgi:hypothetical protein